MNIKKLKFLEKLLTKYNHDEVYFSYEKEELNPKIGEVAISVKDDCYHIYTNKGEAKYEEYNFKDEEMVLLYIACLFKEDKNLYKEITNFIDDKENQTLMTDFYELTMAQTYFNEGKKDEKVYFDIFFRKNPFKSGYTMSGGLDETIKYIENFRFTESDIEYLQSLGKFNDEFLDYLKDLEFKGDIYGIPDGTAVFPNEPVLTVETDIITAQILETALLANFNHGSLVTTAAKRITSEANNNGKPIPVMEFGARRARGIDSAIEASKNAYIGGCCGTSNTKAGKKYGIPVLGTMAHSLVTESENEYEAFLGYAKSNPDNCIFLVDTYDTIKSGIPNAIRVANEYLKPNGFPFKGIRIDSGDLAYLSKEARKMLDAEGFKDADICASNDLDEHIIADLKKQGAKITSWGVGTHLITSKDCPSFGGVYKLAAIKKEGKIIQKIKLSEDRIKITNPGDKQVFRFYDKETGKIRADMIGYSNETYKTNQNVTLFDPIDTWKKTELKANTYTVKELLKPIFINGKCVYETHSVMNIRSYCTNEKETLSDENKRFLNPHKVHVDLSQDLWETKNKMIEELSTQKDLQKVKK